MSECYDVSGATKLYRSALYRLGMAEHHMLDANVYLSMDIPVAAVARQTGTRRFGTDPNSSASDSSGWV